jgi:mRNA turnover protein 4
MPRSKRAKVVSLTKTQPKDKSHKTKLIADLRDALDEYSSVFVFSYENMRTVVFKEVREHFEGSKISLVKNKVAQVALGKSEADEYKENIHLLGEKIEGESGLLFTDAPKEEVLEYFAGLRVADYAKAGAIAKESIVMKPGPLKFPVDMLEQMRKLGLVVEILNGAMVLKTGFQVTLKGEPLTPEQAKVLVHMGKKLSVFQVRCTGFWSDGEFEDLEEEE